MAFANLYLQVAYAKRLGTGLQRFEQKGPSSFNFRCPVCGDSKKSETKKRGWFYEKQGTLNFACHNCSASSSFEKFLKERNPQLYSEFLVDKFGDSPKDAPKETPKPKIELQAGWENYVTPVSRSPHALKYLRDRKIPEDRLKDLYYTPNVRETAIDLFDFYGLDFDKKLPNEDGILIPFTTNGILTFAQVRTFSQNKNFRYLTISFGSEDIKLYNYDYVDLDKDVFVTEGPFDSMFLDNAVATADSTLTRASIKIDRDKLVLVHDNEPRSPQIVKKIEDALKANYKVVMFPDYIQEKDINDMFIAGYDVQMLVDQNQYYGLNGLLKFSTWRKC